MFAGTQRARGVGGSISDPFVLGADSGSAHVRAHVLKAGEDVTVLLSSAADITPGDYLTPVANGLVAKQTDTKPKMFRAIEGCTSTSSGDELRILARVM